MAPEGPSSKILEAMASPSISGGGWINLSFLRYRQVILIGIGAFLGGMITRTPECLHPRMAPPRASTMKLTKNLLRMAFIRILLIYVKIQGDRTWKIKVEKYTNTEGFSWKIVDFFTQHFSNMHTLYEMLSSTSQDMESHLQRAGKSCYVKCRNFLLQGVKNQIFL